MKIRENLDISTENFWYDLVDGGYLEPERLCENKEDAVRVREAMKVLIEFEQSCEEQIVEDFFR